MMTIETYLRFGSALLLVLAAIGLLVALLRILSRRFGLPSVSHRGSRIGIEDVRSLDHRRRIVLIRCGDREHLLLLGVNTETVIESTTCRSIEEKKA